MMMYYTAKMLKKTALIYFPFLTETLKSFWTVILFLCKRESDLSPGKLHLLLLNFREKEGFPQAPEQVPVVREEVRLQATGEAVGGFTNLLKLCFSFSILVSFLFLNSCKKDNGIVVTTIKPKGGVLDLRGLDLTKLEPFPLAGEWDAFPGKLPKSESEFLSLEKEKPKALAIPGYWVNQNLPAHGFVTYRLRILVDEPGGLMVYLREASSAYKLFSWNPGLGLSELGSAGKLSTNKEDSIGYYTESARAFRVQEGTVLYLLVSNYLYSRGGPYYSPVLGSSGKTLVWLRFKERKKLFFVGVFFLLALYHFVLFFHRSKERYTFWYALLCFSWLIRILLFERITRDWFEPSDFMEMLQIRLEYLAFISAQLFSVLFFFDFFAAFLRSKVRNLYLIPIAFFGIVISLAPYQYYTKLLQVTQAYMVIILLSSLYAAVKSIQNKDTRYTGFVFLIGSFVILFTTIFDSIVFLKRWDLPFLTDFGFSIYSICLAVIISSRNSYAWETAEYLTLNLRKEVDWKTIELRREKERAEKASEMKDKFISIVSHDIRSPLFGISSVVNLLTETPPSLSPENTKQVLGDASSGLKNLLSMVEELIQYSRFQNATVFPDYQLFDYYVLAESLLEKAKPLADAKKIILTTDVSESSVGIGDPNLIEHLLWNLISNSIKFTHNGGSIRLSLSEEDKVWCFSVEDSGIGIPEVWLSTIFDSGFNYLRKGTNDEIGAGVGLAFCKEVTDRHGGRLEALSQNEKGSTFKFYLPNYEKVVLLLDDNPGYRNQLRKILKGLPCIVWEEEFPDHAIRSIGKLKPDLIIVDYAMPDKTGIQFLQELYSDNDMVEIRSLLLSSSQTDPNTGKKLEEDVIAIGGDAFLKKTVSDERLLSEIKKLLSLN
ncbi:histidine kinase [Leptospira kobayashii]|uniref:histidine kinase n=2 Tax=Leptospira kobayashii TaxID=1917830 RepID=A0ABN6KKU0_9LEPT|nr:histidine kinase [Leptospira kobayashii]